MVDSFHDGVLIVDVHALGQGHISDSHKVRIEVSCCTHRAAFGHAARTHASLGPHFRNHVLQVLGEVHLVQVGNGGRGIK